MHEIGTTETACDPPRMFTEQGEVHGGSRPVVTSGRVEARAGHEVPRPIVYSWAPAGRVRHQLEGAKSGWSGFLAHPAESIVTHFRGQRSAIMQSTAPDAGPDADSSRIADHGLRGHGLAPTALDDAAGVSSSAAWWSIRRESGDVRLRLDIRGQT